MAKIIEKLKDFFSGTVIYKTKKRPDQPAVEESSKRLEEGPKTGEKAEEQK